MFHSNPILVDFSRNRLSSLLKNVDQYNTSRLDKLTQRERKILELAIIHLVDKQQIDPVDDNIFNKLWNDDYQPSYNKPALQKNFKFLYGTSYISSEYLVALIKQKYQALQTLRTPSSSSNAQRQPTDESTSFSEVETKATVETTTEKTKTLPIDAEKSMDLSLITQKVMDGYNTAKPGWVRVPPRDEMVVDQPFTFFWGAMGFEGSGRWKIHISIDPNQMEQAIPILVKVLLAPDSPRSGFKMATKALLQSEHQTGKELALYFDKALEQEALDGHPERVEKCLSLLWNELYKAGIRPEQGYVLTPQTMDAIRNAPEGTQNAEKTNLKGGKFDRAIRGPQGINYFHYREDDYLALETIPDNLKDNPMYFSWAHMMDLARNQPDYAHNPMKSPDPYLNIKIEQL